MIAVVEGQLPPLTEVMLNSDEVESRGPANLKTWDLRREEANEIATALNAGENSIFGHGVFAEEKEVTRLTWELSQGCVRVKPQELLAIFLLPMEFWQTEFRAIEPLGEGILGLLEIQDERAEGQAREH